MNRHLCLLSPHSFVHPLFFFFSITLFAWELPSPEKAKDPSAEIKNASSLSYPYEAEFKERSKIVIEGLADGSLEKWRKGYFSGGDPGKYLPGHAMAKLLLNPDDPEPAKYMNDERSYKEHYHFAAVNWARFFPIFRDVLTPVTSAKFADEAAKYNSYIQMGGTENHKVMWWTSANVLPYYVVGKRFGGKDIEESLQISKENLKKYVKGLYEAGQGEWDSSTYLIFDVNGMLNIYDFSKDEECRLIAKAALDWYCTTYALKYRDGIFCGPNQRGFSDAPFKSLMDQTGYLWWGGSKKLSPQDAKDFRYTLHAITSSYRPNKIISNIAMKKIEGLPVEQKNSKANYWHGQSIPWEAGTYHETLYIANNYSMGSLWDGHGSQITRFQIVASTPSGAVSFTGGSPRKSDHTGKKIDFGYSDGIGRYDQSIQVGPVYISMSYIPEDEKYAYSFFSIPSGYEPKKCGDWFIFEVHNTFVAVQPLGSEAEIGETDLSEKEKQINDENILKNKDPQFKTSKIIKIPGRKIGFIVQTAGKPKYKNLEAFSKTLEKTVDLANFANRIVVFKDIDGRTIEMKFNPDMNGDKHGDKIAECTVNGARLHPSRWEIYGGPIIEQKNSVLKVSDCKESFSIDFSGNLPVYK